MLNFCEFSRSFKDYFFQSNSIRTEKLSELSGRRLAIDSRFFAPFFIDIMGRDRDETIPSIAQDILNKFKEADIIPIFIFGGVDSFRAEEDYFGYFFQSYWSLRKRRFDAEGIADTSKRRDEIKRVKKINAVNCMRSLDLIEMFVCETLSKLFFENKVDHIKAPQLREAQMASLYREGAIDGIVGSPLCFLMGDIPNVITSIDFEEKTFTFMSQELMMKNLNFEDKRQMREILQVAASILELDPDFQKIKKLLDKIEDWNLCDILKNVKICEEKATLMLQTTVSKLIERLGREELEDFEQVANILAQDFQFDKKIFCKLLDFFRHPLTYEFVNSRVVGLKNENGFILDVLNEELIILFCLGVIEWKLLCFFSKNLNHELSLPYERKKDCHIQQIEFELLFSAMKRSIESCVHLLGQPQIEFKFTTFNDSLTFKISFEEPRTISSFICFSSQTTLGSILREFSDFHHLPERFLKISSEIPLSQKCIFEHLYIKFLDSCKIIDLKRKSISILGKILAKFWDSPFIEELLFFVMLTFSKATYPNIASCLSGANINGDSQDKDILSKLKSFNSWDLGITSFMRDFQKHNLNAEFDDCFGPISESERENIRLVCRLAELMPKSFPWLEQSDFDLFQFSECYRSIRNAFHKTFISEMLNLLFHSNAFGSSQHYDQVLYNLPFLSKTASSPSVLLSVWLGRYIAYLRISSKGKLKREASKLISFPHIRRYYCLNFDFFDLMNEIMGMFDHVKTFISECLTQPIDPMREHSELMQQYLKAIEFFREFHRVVIRVSQDSEMKKVAQIV